MSEVIEINFGGGGPPPGKKPDKYLYSLDPLVEVGLGYDVVNEGGGSGTMLFLSTGVSLGPGAQVVLVDDPIDDAWKVGGSESD